MINHKYKDIEFSEVGLHELNDDMRMDAQYYEPFYIRNAELIERKPTKRVKDFMYEPQYGISVAMNEEGEGYKILKMDDIVGLIANDDNAKYADIDERIFNQFKLNKYDVLFNRVNSDEYVGRTGIYLMDGAHTFASYLIRLSSSEIYQNFFLTTFLNCRYGYRALQRVKRRAVNQANINAKELKHLLVPFPSVQFQEKIKELIMLSHAQKLESEELYKRAEESLLLHLGLNSWRPKERMISLKGNTFTVEDSINEVELFQTHEQNRIDSEYYQPKYDAIEDRIINYKEGYSSLSQVIIFIDTGEYSPEYQKKSKGLVFYIRNTNIKRGIINFDENYYVCPNSFKKLVHEGDIITARVGAIGSFGIVSKDFEGSIFSDNVLRFRLKESLNPNVYTLLFNSSPYVNLLKRIAGGSVQPLVTQSTIKKLFIPLLNQSIQDSTEKLINKSQRLSKLSNTCSQLAIRAVEIYVEQDEITGLAFIEKQLKEL